MPESKDKYKTEIDEHSGDKQYVDDIIIVGAHTDKDQIWGYSSRISSISGSVYGPVVDVFAPGGFSEVHHIATWIGFVFVLWGRSPVLPS